MWAQDWVTLAPEVKPFKDLPSFDTTDSMIKNVRKLFIDSGHLKVFIYSLYKSIKCILNF